MILFINDAITTTALLPKPMIRTCSIPITSHQPIVVLSAQRRDDHDDDEPVLIEASNDFFHFLSRPIFSNVRLGFPFALMVVWIISPAPVAALSTVLFGGLAWLGRALVVDENTDASTSMADATAVDFSSLGLAVLASNVLVPTGEGGPSFDLGVLIGVPVVLLAVGQVVMALKDTSDEKRTPQDRLLDIWDDEFNSENSKKETGHWSSFRKYDFEEK